MDAFKVRVSDGVKSDTITMKVSVNGGVEPAGVKTVAANARFNIFPNPASSTLNIEWDNQHGGAMEVVISDVTDHVYYRETTDQAHGMQLNVASLPVGVYMIKVNNEVSKFVKQ
jgi:hypothetical protein